MKIQKIENASEAPETKRQYITRDDDPQAVGEIILIAMSKGAVVVTALSQPHQNTIQWSVGGTPNEH